MCPMAAVRTVRYLEVYKTLTAAWRNEDSLLSLLKQWLENTCRMHDMHFVLGTDHSNQVTFDVMQVITSRTWLEFDQAFLFLKLFHTQEREPWGRRYDRPTMCSIPFHEKGSSVREERSLLTMSLMWFYNFYLWSKVVYSECLLESGTV